MDSTPPATNRCPPGLVVFAGLVAGAYLAAEVYLLHQPGQLRFGFPLDDSWIHLVFARSLAAGAGLSFDPGTLVSGSTAPLWTAVLSLLFLLPGDVVGWTKLFGACCFLGTVVLTWHLGRAHGLERRMAALATVLVALTDALVWSAWSGMEIHLFTVLSLAGVVRGYHERQDPTLPPLSFLLLGLACLARPEGWLLLTLALVDRAVVCRREQQVLRFGWGPLRQLLTGLGIAAVVLLPVIVFNLAVGNSVFPSTFAAKAGGDFGALPDGYYLHTVVGVFMRPQPFATLLAGAGVLVLSERLGTREDRGLLLAAWVVGLPLAYSLLSPEGRPVLVGSFGRYYFPLFPPLVVLGVLGLARFAAILGPFVRVGSQVLALRAVLTALLIVPTFITWVRGAARYSQNVMNVDDSDVTFGKWLAHNVPPDALLAVQDIGAVKFFAANPILDLCGIVTPEMVTRVRTAIGPEDPQGQRGVEAILEERQPELLLAYPSWYPTLTRDRGRYQPIARLPIPGNITMAGDELVLYRTPWTRAGLIPSSPPAAWGALDAPR